MAQSLLCLCAPALASPGRRAGALCRKGLWQVSWSGPFAEILLEARHSVKEREACKGDDRVPNSFQCCRVLSEIILCMLLHIMFFGDSSNTHYLNVTIKPSVSLGFLIVPPISIFINHIYNHSSKDLSKIRALCVTHNHRVCNPGKQTRIHFLYISFSSFTLFSLHFFPPLFSTFKKSLSC